jgi:hypothetical protein
MSQKQLQVLAVDVFAEDMKTVNHAKVTAKVACIFSENDTVAA